MLALITPTRGRPRALAICREYVRRMTLPPGERVLHLVVEGTEDQSRTKLVSSSDLSEIHIARHQRADLDGHRSLADLLREGITVARNWAHDEKLRIAVIEDDDWYAPDYLIWLDEALRRSPLVGEADAIYYNVQNRTWRACQNRSHASLCSTAWNDEAVGSLVDYLLLAALEGEPFLDVQLWRQWKGETRLESPRRRRVIGLKGLPGRRNIGVGGGDHPNADPGGEALRELIGADADRYTKMYGHNATT